MRADQVDRDGDLDPVAGEVVVGKEGAGVVDDGVEGAAARRLVRHPAHVVELAHVGDHDGGGGVAGGHGQLGHGLVGAGLVTPDGHEVGAELEQPGRRGPADATGDPGDEDPLAVEAGERFPLADPPAHGGADPAERGDHGDLEGQVHGAGEGAFHGVRPFA